MHCSGLCLPRYGVSRETQMTYPQSSRNPVSDWEITLVPAVLLGFQDRVQGL
jgi:hypothetical protein